MKKTLFVLVVGVIALNFGCATQRWVIPQTKEKIPFSLEKPLKIESLPEKFVDVATVIEGSNETGIYVKANSGVPICNGDIIVSLSATLKIGPNLIIPISKINGTCHTFGKITDIKDRIKLSQVRSAEYILSGPNGSTLKRTSEKELTLIEGEAFLLK